MAWTTPKTDWATGELVTAADMNAVGENLAVLGNPPKPATLERPVSSTKGSRNDFVDVDSDNLNLTITTTGGMYWLHFHWHYGSHASRR